MSLPTFADFYTDVHERPPFPWQVRLADDVLANGWADLALALPTGAGKTSAIDVALYCLAREPAVMPRRTVLVVDRRVVVDQAAEHAKRLLQRMRTTDASPRKAVADALRELVSDDAAVDPFHVTVMRGGMPRDNDWARWPHQPTVGLSTVDQVGSRLLFRGYGVHPRSASIHAGLIGNDTLVLLDEVHLATAFESTLAAVRDRRGRTASPLPARFHVVPMTATPRSRVGRVFETSAADRDDPRLRARLTANKRASLVSVKVPADDEAGKRAAIAKRAVDEALLLQQQGAKVVGIVVNRVDTARLAYRYAHECGAAGVLVTGRMRPLDRDRIVKTQLRPRADGSRKRSASDEPFLVIATQCIEAGADLDLDALVTECASIDALKQRFGRVDRRGELGATMSVILGPSDLEKGKDPVYGEALAATWTWLGKQATASVVDMGIEALASPPDDLFPPVPDAPILMPAHIDAWSQTSLPIDADPDIALWLHGPHRATADVQVVWRAIADLDRASAEATLEAVRPSSLESVTIPLSAARQWLAGDDVNEIADVETSDAPDDVRRGKRSGATAQRWTGDGLEEVKLTELRPGDIVIVDIGAGGLGAGSFDPESKDVVEDLGDIAQLRGRGIATLRLTSASLANWGITASSSTLAPEADESTADFRRRLQEWIESWGEQSGAGCPAPEDAKRLVRAFKRRIALTAIGDLWVATAPVPRDPIADSIVFESVTESSDSSFQSQDVSLRVHSGDVETFVAEFCERLGLPATVVSDLKLAAWLHDIGKADPRFQAWLAGGDELRASVLTEPLAKSQLDPGNAQRREAARERARYPKGYRHELLSLAMLEGAPEALRGANDAELVKHLVASHHGWCRPLAAPVDDERPVAVELTHRGQSFTTSSRHQMQRLDSGVIDRFWDLNRRYGWWGLAWLEAILRLADHRASEYRTDGGE